MRSLAIFAFVLAVIATAASANVPDPPSSHVDGHLLLVGQTGGHTGADCKGAFVVVVRDASRNAIPGSTVVVDLSACTDMQMSCDQSVGAGQAYLAGKKIAGTTNAVGQFTFYLQGASTAVMAPGIATSPGVPATATCANVYADGVLMGQVSVAALDIDGSGSPSSAFDATDLKLVAHEAIVVALGATARARDDYNGDRRLTGTDLAVLAGYLDLNTACDPACGCTRQTVPFCP